MRRIERVLAGCDSFLSYGDKLVLVRFVFHSLPIFFMCTLTLPIEVMEQINKYLRHFFWIKYGMEDRGTTLMLGRRFASPKIKGVLEFLILLFTTNACLWNIYTNFSIKMIYHGYK